MYDQKTDTKTSQENINGHQRQADPVGYSDGQLHPVHFRIGNGGQLYAWFVGKGSGQCRNIQNDFTRIQYTHRWHDWVFKWY